MSVSDGRILGPKNPGSRAVPSGGKGDKSRYIRPVERQRMRPWLIDHLEKNDVPGLTWQNRNDHVFRISWKHAANQCFNMQNDTNLFERWAIHTGRHEESDHKRWKANFRCALNSLPDVIELKEYGIKKGSNAFKVYKFLDEKESRANKEHKAKMKRDPTSYGGYEYVQSRKYRSDSDHEETAEAVPSLPNLSSLYTPLSTVEMVVETDSRDDTQEVDMDNLQEILTAAQASLEAGIDAAALEKISIEQLSKMGDLSKMKLDIRSTGTESPIEPMYVFVCNWCEKVFPSKVELFQHFLTAHQERLLAHEEYQREGSSLQREIEDLEKKVLNFTREKYKSKDSGEVIEDGQVVDMSSTNIMTSQDVYIEDQALDLSMTQTPAVKQEEALDLTTEAVAGKHKMQLKASQPKLITKKRRSGALDMDYIKKFDDYGLAGRPQTKRQLSLVTKKKEEKEKSKKGGVKKSSDSSKQHSVEDLVHAEILISLKSGANEDEEEEMESDPETVTDVEDDAADKDGSVKSEKSATSSKSNTDADRKPVTCGICSNVFEDAAKLYAHVTEHKNEYKCGMCQTVYHTKDEYVKHLGTHVSTSESSQDAGKAAKTFTCSICEKTFSSAKLLESHKDEHYTVTPIRTSNKKVAMVVHPSTSLLTSKKDKTAASSESREDQKPAEAKEDAKVIVSSASKSDKVAKIVSSDGEEIYVLYSDIDDGTGQGDKKKGKTSDKAFDQDSVDGDKQTITKVGSNAKGSNISVKEKDGHLPAFSEIVKDVDEFFIKDVRSESESQSEKDLETDTDASKTETAASTSADTSENAPDISLEISPPSSQDPHGDSNHSDEEDNRCVICMEELDSTQSLKEHMKLHSIFELTNAKCFEKALKGLKAGEVSDVHADSEKKSKLFICKLCHEEFEQFLDLKEHVSKHLEKPASGKAKRGRPPKRFLDKPESPKAKRHDSKIKQSNSVLAAALNTGPKFPIQTHFKNGKPKKHYLLNEKGDGTLKEGASLEKKFKDDSDHENVDVEKVEVLTKSTAVKKAANSDSVKATPVAITQNFASKLLVQGVTSFLNQKEKNIFFPNSTSIPTGTTASAPKSAQQPTLQVLTPTFLPNAGGAASAISIGGKVTPLHQLRFINTSDIKTAVSPQVIFLKQGSPLPVQLTSQLNALHQNTIAVSQVAGLQTTTIPASKLSTMVTLPIVSLPQQLIASTLTSAKPNLDPSVIAPTVKQMISTQKSVPQVLPTVVPVSMVKTLAQYAPQVTVVSTLKAVPSITTIPTLNLASLQPVRTTISDLSPKFTISLAALQGLATVDLKQKTVNIPVTTKGATYTVPTDTSLPTTRVNPQTQNNLLNMVLARMGQPGQVSVSRPSNQTTPETTASLPASVSLLSGTATLSSAPSVIESGVAASSTQLSPAAQGNVETPLKLSNENMHKSSGEFGKGVVLFSYICKGNLASLEELTSDSCSQATTTSSDTVTTVSTGALQTSPT
ncbi:uncharacterized protein LOC127882168 isoform X2 [Dreissena polymorpha]|nr:uncharacterized protein LOC127882168 isoform X2 [Dreissena polymorpha]